MDVSLFVDGKTGDLIEISGSDPRRGAWRHVAFRPWPLPSASPSLTGTAYRAVADARAALAALDSTSRRLPDPTLLRIPTLRREAQATASLEGTYAPLADVYAADPDAEQSPEMREILNYLTMADHAFRAVAGGRSLTVPLLEDLQHLLVAGTGLEGRSSGRVRDVQVVIGVRTDASPTDHAIHSARFVPPPPGGDLVADLRSLVAWMTTDHRGGIDPVVVAAMSHYQFETLHPFHDGNGRIGRLLVTLQLHISGVLREPTLTISPWFEARRAEYYERLLAVSAAGDWDGWVTFFAEGLRASADATLEQMLDLVEVQTRLKDVVRDSTLRAETALDLVDVAVAHPIFSVRRAAAEIGVSIGRANTLVNQLVELGVLARRGADTYDRRFCAPDVLEVLLRSTPNRTDRTGVLEG